MKSGVLNITLFFATLILALCWTTDAYCCNKLVLQKSASVQSQFKKEGATYVVKYDFDLKGAEIIVPKDCKLYFKGGSFKNGTIKGEGTTVSAGRVIIFYDMTLSGSWSNKKVYSEWLDFVEKEKVDNAKNFRNLMLLCSGDEMTHLYMQKGVFYCSVVTGSSNIIVPSNVYWHNAATICQLPTNSQKYGFVLIKKSDNVTIDGGEFVGDVQTHTGTDGEWGHGIKVAGSSNVVLKNLVSREFWGDGIDLIEANYVSEISAGVGPCCSVTMDNVKCLYNRRQGLSIEAARNVIVKNSEFAFTGKYKLTEPGAGIVIEPWCKNEEKVANIRFYNCSAHDNSPKMDFCVEANLQYFNGTANPSQPPVNDITVNKCRVGRLSLFGANTVTFTNCVIEDIIHYNHGENIEMVDCIIKKKTGFKTRLGVRTPTSLTMIRCTE